MYKHIFVAVDGSKTSHQAFKKASETAIKTGAHLIICHVIDARNTPWTTTDEGELWKEVKNEATKLVEDYAEIARNWGVKNVQTVVLSGNPRVEIPKNLTKEYDVDLLVIGATGQNAIERMVIGSVAEASIRHAPCDVLLIKNEADLPLYHQVLVGVDGSEQAEEALYKAIDLAQLYDSKLIIAHIDDQTPDLFSKDTHIKQDDERERQLLQMLSTYTQEANNRGVKDVASILNYGNPRDHMAHVLPVQNDVELLITAATGRGTVERLFTGSVALASAHHAPCDVLTVRS